MKAIAWSTQLSDIMRDLKSSYSAQELAARLRDRNFVKTLPISATEQEALFNKATTSDVTPMAFWQN